MSDTIMTMSAKIKLSHLASAGGTLLVSIITLITNALVKRFKTNL